MPVPLCAPGRWTAAPCLASPSRPALFRRTFRSTWVGIEAPGPVTGWLTLSCSGQPFLGVECGPLQPILGAWITGGASYVSVDMVGQVAQRRNAGDRE